LDGKNKRNFADLPEFNRKNQRKINKKQEKKMIRVIKINNTDLSLATTDKGTMQAKVMPQNKFLPISVKTPNSSSGYEVSEKTSKIWFNTSQGKLELTEKGFKLNAGRLTKYSKASYTTIANLIKTDKFFHKSAINLQKAINSTVFEFAASEKLGITKKTVDVVLASNTKQKVFYKKGPNHNCKVETVVDTVTTEVEGWITSVVTAAQQLAQCEANCLSKPLLDIPGCMVSCAIKAFEDIVTRTWGVVDTITTEVTKEVIHCTFNPKQFPTPWGSIDFSTNIFGNATLGPRLSNADIVNALGPFGDVLKCIVKAKWDLTKLANFNLNITGIDQIPFGVSVCLDRACTDTLKVAATGAGLTNLVAGLISTIDSVGIAGAITALGLDAAVGAIAAAAGVSVAMISQIILAALLVFAVHALIVAGQIIALDVLGLAPNGICLNYPALPGIAVGVINPLIGSQILANTPIIVTPKP
jgi:hypothetical protein